MRRLLNFGVSDPLTLGMGHPVADRLETLGRIKPITIGGRATVLAVMGGLAVMSAPFTLAADRPEVENKIRYKFVSSEKDSASQGYEVVSENGETRAYVILENGDREPARLESLEDGTFRLTYDDGQTIDLPNMDGMNLEGLRGLKSLEGLEGLKQIKILGNLTGLESLEGLEGLAGLKGLAELSAFAGLDFETPNFEVFKLDRNEFEADLRDEILAKFPENLREMIENTDGKTAIEITQSGNFPNSLSFSSSDGDIFTLPDSVLDWDYAFVEDKNPLGQALRQLERTERQLDKIANDENLSFDLENARRDLENARKSLEAASERLGQQK